MTTRTSISKGLPKPHKAMKPVMGNGRSDSNARSIATERAPNKKVGTGGVASSYYANSRACNGEK
jgi:hypothetical protein